MALLVVVFVLAEATAVEPTYGCSASHAIVFACELAAPDTRPREHLAVCRGDTDDASLLVIRNGRRLGEVSSSSIRLSGWHHASGMGGHMLLLAQRDAITVIDSQNGETEQAFMEKRRFGTTGESERLDCQSVLVDYLHELERLIPSDIEDEPSSPLPRWSDLMRLVAESPVPPWDEALAKATQVDSCGRDDEQSTALVMRVSRDKKELHNCRIYVGHTNWEYVPLITIAAPVGYCPIVVQCGDDSTFATIDWLDEVKELRLDEGALVVTSPGTK